MTYCRTGGIDLRIDLFFPGSSAPARAPAALFLHGGGWVAGDKGESDWLQRIREPLLERGFVVASANYRLAPSHPWPAQIEDAKCAIRFLRAQSEAYGIDDRRLGAWGTSAGGHLAAMLGATDAGAGFEGDGGHASQSSRVQAVVDFYGPADLTDGEAWPAGQSLHLEVVFGTSDLDSPVLAGASPTTHVTRDDPPFLILHGDRDPQVPARQSELLFQRLGATGVPAELVIVENARHGLEPVGGEIRPSEEELVEKVVEFFETNLR
ncbi:MAG: alpha/beta hydrolase fold domain-containing protein [Gemmatimonadota bacterium]